MKTLIKSGFAKRTTVYGILISLVVLGGAAAFGSLVLGAIGILSLAIHVTAKH
jgi:hypothetical protein